MQQRLVASREIFLAATGAVASPLIWGSFTISIVWPRSWIVKLSGFRTAYSSRRVAWFSQHRCFQLCCENQYRNPENPDWTEVFDQGDGASFHQLSPSLVNASDSVGQTARPSLGCLMVSLGDGVSAILTALVDGGSRWVCTYYSCVGVDAREE